MILYIIKSNSNIRHAQVIEVATLKELLYK